MDPYLETPALWPMVHDQLIAAIADKLFNQLSEQYRIHIGQRTYFSSTQDNLLIGIPEVTIVTSGMTPPAVARSQPIQPQHVTVPVSTEIRERYLEIYAMASGEVVTLIEILSPHSKRLGEGRTTYERKRNQILASSTHLVEIDLLRGGKPFPVSSKILGDYRILICRGNQRPAGELYAFSLRQPIPPIPIPLLPDDPEPILALQPLLNWIYTRDEHIAIDYTHPPQPPLPPSHRQWVQTLLGQQWPT